MWKCLQSDGHVIWGSFGSGKPKFFFLNMCISGAVFLRKVLFKTQSLLSKVLFLVSLNQLYRYRECKILKRCDISRNGSERQVNTTINFKKKRAIYGNIMCNNPQKLYYYILYLYSNASQENYFTTYKIFFKLVWKFIDS